MPLGLCADETPSLIENPYQGLHLNHTNKTTQPFEAVLPLLIEEESKEKDEVEKKTDVSNGGRLENVLFINPFKLHPFKKIELPTAFFYKEETFLLNQVFLI